MWGRMHHASAAAHRHVSAVKRIERPAEDNDGGYADAGGSEGGDGGTSHFTRAAL